MTRKTIIVGALSLGIVGALFCILAGAVFCRATLHVPRRLGPPPPNSTSVTLVAADHAQLAAWWLPSPNPNGNCVAVLHGIGDSRVGSSGFAPLFLDWGYSVLLPDSRAHGSSGGDLVTYGLIERHDVVAWAHWMKRAGCRKVYALGESLGASILIQAAEVEPVFTAIVAECPFADLQEIAEYRVRQIGIPAIAAKLVVGSAMVWAAWVDALDFHQVSPVRSIAHAATPILLIHGLKDSRTPPYNSEQLANANPRDPFWLVPDAPHVGASRVAPEEFRRRVLAWFGDH